MNRTRAFLNNTIGRARFLFASWRRKILEVCRLSRKHWRWAAFGVLALMVFIVAGLLAELAGILSIPVLLMTMLFYLGLPLLAGLGVHIALKLIRVIPDRVNWFFFGAIFFILFNFGFPQNALAVLALYLLFSGSFLGAGIYNVTGGRWKGLSVARRVLTLFFLVTGAGLFSFGSWYLLFPGKEAEEITPWSMETVHMPGMLMTADPSLPGKYEVDSLTYGSGMDRRRPEFGEEAAIITPRVDGTAFLDGWDGWAGKLRSAYWKLEPDSLPLNGRVWFPRGEGPFPLVLLVHGNHMDRDFSDPGYAYLGRHFASHGMIAVSVDENFLNGAWSDMDKGLKTENDCRGWLLLKHLEQWRKWNGTDTILFHGRVDMDRIVAIGHSRGGEAVSIASCFNRLEYYPDNADERFDFNFGIRGIAAIAPVDGQYWPAGVATPVVDVNYFTLHGSMDGDMRSFNGLRQMRRVAFSGKDYYFASGLYIHGANHGQFNRHWGSKDINYPNSLMLNRRAIIPVEQQEQVALVYLTAFALESVEPGTGYLPLFRDYRTGRDWLPSLVFLNQFHESSSLILCDYEEDIDLTTGGPGIACLESGDLALWKEGRIPMKWDNQRNSGVYLGWNNEMDSVPGWYRITLDSTVAEKLTGITSLTFLAADADTDPGVRQKPDSAYSAPPAPADTSGTSALANTSWTSASADSSATPATGDTSGTFAFANTSGTSASADTSATREERPIDFSIILCDEQDGEYRARLGDYQLIQPPIRPQVFKSPLFWNDPESEVILQYVEIPLDAFRDTAGSHPVPGSIRAIRFEFDGEGARTVILDQIGFTKQPPLED